MTTRILGTALATLVLIASAYADTPGNKTQPGEQNILIRISETGSTIDGVTNRTNTMVQFASTTDTLLAKGGQTDIDAADGEINNITLTVPGHTFNDLMINPFEPVSIRNVMVTVHLSNGKTIKDTFGNTHGEAFLTITTTGGELISSVAINSTGGFLDLKQPRISGISGESTVPEPGTLGLLGTGLICLAGLARRKLKRGM